MMPDCTCADGTQVEVRGATDFCPLREDWTAGAAEGYEALGLGMVSHIVCH